MSLKKLLGLEAFALTEEEIVEKIQQAYSQNDTEIEFSSKAKRVVVRVAQPTPVARIATGGAMRGNEAEGGRPQGPTASCCFPLSRRPPRARPCLSSRPGAG